MRARRILESLQTQEEVVASFGEAQLVRTPDGKSELRGGSDEDRRKAKEWMALFWHEPKPERRR